MACKYWFISWPGLCDLKVVIVILCFFVAFAFLILLKHGDVEINHGPKKKEARFFCGFHWNVNSILTHSKLSLLEAYNTIHKYDILCISETYLDSSLSVDDTTLSLPLISANIRPKPSITNSLSCIDLIFTY